MLEKALNLANYEEMLARRNEARRSGKLTGIGMSFYIEISGFAPGFVFQHLRLQLGGYDTATIRMDPQGKITVTSGVFPHGQGLTRAFRRFAL